MTKKINIVVLHDWLDKFAGAEKVLEQILKIYPKVDLFTIVDHMEKKDRKFLKDIKIKKSFIQYLPFSKKLFRYYFFLFPFAVRFFNLNKYNVIISSSHSFIKNIKKRKDQLHICYCHTPMRYAHVMMKQYIENYGFKNFFIRNSLKIALTLIGKWDIVCSKNVDFFVANSNFIKRRIKKYYKKDSVVIAPPVDTNKFAFKKYKRDFYLTASRLVPYKKIDLVIKTFNNLPNKTLYVIGSGPQIDNYVKLAKPNVKILGWTSDNDLVKYMQNAKAFIFAPLEDFGIIPVEAQSCGTPVIAFGKGGVMDTIIDYPKNKATGIFFKKQNISLLNKSILKFEKNYKKFNPSFCRNNSKKFSEEKFFKKFKEYTNQLIYLRYYR